MTKKKQKSATLEDIIKALALDAGKTKSDSHAYGEVKSINQDGSYNVALNGANITTRCARLAGAKVGDTVFVTILKNGFAVVTNTVGGDGDAADALTAFKKLVEDMNNVTVTAGSQQSVTIEYTVPDGYTPIGLLTISIDNPVAINSWKITGGKYLKLILYNPGASDVTVSITAAILCTALDV